MDSEAVVHAPWDEDAIGSPYTASCFVAFLWLLLACVCGCVALALLVPGIEQMVKPDTYPNVPVVSFVMFVIGIALCYVVWRALRRAARVSELRRAHTLKELCLMDGQGIMVALVPVGLSLGLQGTAAVTFDDDSMSLEGRIVATKPLYVALALPLSVVGIYIGERFQDDRLLGAALLGLVYIIGTLLVYPLLSTVLRKG